MTPRTRTSNRDANFTPYFSKKGPKQQYFSHRRKVVRRPDGPEQEYKQMKFLPEKMRSMVGDWQEDSEDEVLEEDIATVESQEKTSNKLPMSTEKKGNKRSRDVMDHNREEEELIQPTPKRTRAPASKQKTRSPAIDNESISDNDSSLPQSSPPPSDSELQQDKKHRRRRQSTMTQLVEGRRPNPDEDEPKFRAAKRRPRSSASRKRQDKQQRTLTQMVPGLVPLVLDSDEDVEETEADGTFDAVLAEQFAKSGVFQLEVDQDEAPSISVAIDSGDQDDEDSYEPTQIVRSPAGTRVRPSRRSSAKNESGVVVATVEKSTPRKKGRLRFSLLATPERRKIREIASSQSPPESPLSTQSTPGTSRLPLRVQTDNVQKPQDTPSKRKQVTFKYPSIDGDAPSSGRRKFDCMVFQDSDEEDEDEGFDEENQKHREGQDIGAETQALINGMDFSLQGRNIGAETQTILEQIDHACAYKNEDGTWRSRDVSEELARPIDTTTNCHESFELGVQQSVPKTEETTDPTHSQVPPYLVTHPLVKQEPRDEVLLGVLSSKELEEPQEQQPENEANLPSPVIIKDESDNEDEALPTPPQPPTLQDYTDLDGEQIQVARSSPPVKQETQDTTCSHSSKAEEQIQSEWLSYSQYQRHRGPPESSMFAVQGPASYQVTTFSDPVARTTAPPQWSAPLSQATTVDPTQRSPTVTPRKQHSRFPNAITTPHKIPSSQPPPLIIPSSFPSSQKTSGEECGGEWSSPVLRSQFARELGNGGMGSVEDFTIPPLPPSDDEEL